MVRNEGRLMPPDFIIRERERAEQRMDRRTERCAMNWELHRAYVQRATIVRSGPDVHLRFASSLEAEEFHRLIQSGRGRK